MTLGGNASLKRVPMQTAAWGDKACADSGPPKGPASPLGKRKTGPARRMEARFASPHRLQSQSDAVISIRTSIQAAFQRIIPGNCSAPARRKPAPLGYRYRLFPKVSFHPLPHRSGPCSLPRESPWPPLTRGLSPPRGGDWGREVFSFSPSVSPWRASHLPRQREVETVPPKSLGTA